MQTTIYFLCKKLGSLKRSLDRLEEKKQSATSLNEYENSVNEMKALTLIRDFIIKTLKETKVKDEQTI